MRFFKVVLLSVLILQGVLVSGVKKTVDIKGVDIPVIYEKDASLPIASMQIIFVGSGSISDDIDGIAKISAALLNEGTKKLGSTAFATKLENRAINLSASTGAETFVIEISSLKEEFPNAVKYAHELLSDPNYDKDVLSKLKTMTLGKIKQKQNNYDYVATQNLKKEIFKDTPLAHSFDGDEESIESIKIKDIKRFIENSLSLKRALIVAGGDIEFEDIKKHIKKVLEGLKKGKSKTIKNYDISAKAKDITLTKETEQAYIYFAAPYRLKVSDKDAYKSKVAAFILGSSGFGSRLMEEIRVKRGLAYSAYARINLSRSNNYFSGYLQTKLQSQEEAIKVVRSVIKEFVEKGVSEDELQKAKQFLLGSEPLRMETLSQRLHRSFNEYYKGLGLGYYKNELDLIQKLTLEDLNSFIKEHDEINELVFSIVTK